MADTISTKSQIPVLYLTQAHLSYEPGVVFREPTSEEFEVMNNLEICYGAKGIMYFAYGGHHDLPVPSGQSPDYFRGLCNPYQNNGYTYYTPRYTNIYGQEKWNRVKKLNEKLKKSGPYIMSFDNANRKSYILRLAGDNLIAETFFNDVITYKPFGNTPTCVEDDPGSNP